MQFNHYSKNSLNLQSIQEKNQKAPFTSGSEILLNYLTSKNYDMQVIFRQNQGLRKTFKVSGFLACSIASENFSKGKVESII